MSPVKEPDEGMSPVKEPDEGMSPVKKPDKGMWRTEQGNLLSLKNAWNHLFTMDFILDRVILMHTRGEITTLGPHETRKDPLYEPRQLATTNDKSPLYRSKLKYRAKLIHSAVN